MFNPVQTNAAAQRKMTPNMDTVGNGNEEQPSFLVQIPPLFAAMLNFLVAFYILP